MANMRAIGGGNPSGMHNYSTSEQIVGTDVDGSTIYERTWYGDNVNWTSTQIIDANFKSSTVKRIVEVKAVVKSTTGTWQAIPMSMTLSSTQYDRYVDIDNSNGFRLIIQNITVGAYHITIQYVKA